MSLKDAEKYIEKYCKRNGSKVIPGMFHEVTYYDLLEILKAYDKKNKRSKE